jgi:hypothetical protein
MFASGSGGSGGVRRGGEGIGDASWDGGSETWAGWNLVLGSGECVDDELASGAVGGVGGCPPIVEGVYTGLGGTCVVVETVAVLFFLINARGIYAGCAGIALSEAV